MNRWIKLFMKKMNMPYEHAVTLCLDIWVLCLRRKCEKNVKLDRI